MEVTHPCGVTQTHHDTWMEGTDNSDVTWTHCGTRTSHGCHRNVTRGWRGLVVMSRGLTVTQGWRGQIEVMSCGLSTT